MSTPAELAYFDELWNARHEDVSRAQLEKELAFESANPVASADVGKLWRAARLQHFLAMQAQENADSAAALRHFSAGENAAQAAMNADMDDEIGPLFWRAVCRLEAARLRGKVAMLRVLAGCERDLQRAEVIDANFHFAGALRVLGRITHQKPLILGGDLDQAMALLKSALKLFPDNSTTQLYYAEVLLADKQRNKARRVLHEIVGAPPDPTWRWEQERDRSRARSLLAATEKP